MQEQLVEEEGVAGSELGRDHRRLPGEVGHDLGSDRPVEHRTAGAGLDDLGQAVGDQVQAGRVDPALGERHPHVHRADALPQERAVLVPVGAGVGGHEAQGGLLHRQRRALAQVLGEHLVEADVVEGLQQVEQRRG